ncbi:MAG: endo alpha-1,4 polygalactosaminidase [Magnetococcales bacterium]|nr:endo alpha-1,4 polygalactosaminidase [Magnetococcales bacterium]
MRHFLFRTFLWPIMALFASTTPASGASFVIYYSDQAPVTHFEPFDLIVFDTLYHPPMERLKERGKTILGYLSLGEVEDHRHHFADAKGQNLLFFENKDWPGSFFVDCRNPLWTKMVIETLIPDILQQGFHGLFIDTMDNPGYLEDLDPKKYKGMRQGGINLIKAIRRNYPDIPIMINRGFDLLDHLIYDVDDILAESTRSTIDPKTQTAILTPDADYEAITTKLRRYKEIRPHIGLYSIDYWDPADLKGRTNIYRQQREHGFIPYVATQKLDQVVFENKP